MALDNQKSARRLRFSLRTALLFVLFVAMLLWAGGVLHERYNSIPLNEAIAGFNVKSQSSSVGKYEPPLTESEVLAAINSQLLTLTDATPQVKAIYRKIVNTRRLPYGASFDDIPGYQSESNMPTPTVWWINLSVMTGPSSGYGLRIRETNDPLAARTTADIVDAGDVLQ